MVGGASAGTGGVGVASVTSLGPSHALAALQRAAAVVGAAAAFTSGATFGGLGSGGINGSASIGSTGANASGVPGSGVGGSGGGGSASTGHGLAAGTGSTVTASGSSSGQLPSAPGSTPLPLSALTSPTTALRSVMVPSAGVSSGPLLPLSMSAHQASPGVSIRALAAGGACESLLAVSGNCSRVSLWRLTDTALGVQCSGSDDDGDDEGEGSALGGGDGSDVEDDREGGVGGVGGARARTRISSVVDDGERRPVGPRRTRMTAAPWGTPAHVFETPHDYVSELCWRGNQVRECLLLLVCVCFFLSFSS